MIMKNVPVGFEIALPVESHARQVMEWRNDPHTLKMSFHSNPKVFDQFLSEFTQSYFSIPDLPPLFILQGGERVGFFRFRQALHPKDKSVKCCEISIQIDPKYRGHGIGGRALQQIAEWVHHQGYDAILAEIKVENTPSVHIFEEAGYKLIETVSKKAENAPLIHSYILEWPRRTTKNRVFVIAEAGSNWRMGTPSRDLAMAKKLIEAAKEAGADAVKFQTFKAATVYVENAGTSDYLSDAGIQEDIRTIFEDLTMPEEMIPKLADYCRQIGIEFMSSFFSTRDFENIDPFVKRHKIASYEITHLRLIEKAAHSGKPLLLSTGASTEEDIAWAVETFRSNGGQDLTLLQCTAKYPADVSTLNLKVIPWLKTRFHCAAGLSDHSSHPIFGPAAAVALGAEVIEKHFTLDQRLPGPDHAFAITAEQLKEMVDTIRGIELTLGTGFKEVLPDEEELYYYARRGLQAIKEIKPGDIFKEGENVDILRPGKQKLGMHPKYLAEIEGKRAVRSIARGQGLEKEDWKHEDT